MINVETTQKSFNKEAQGPQFAPQNSTTEMKSDNERAPHRHNAGNQCRKTHQPLRRSALWVASAEGKLAHWGTDHNASA